MQSAQYAKYSCKMFSRIFIDIQDEVADATADIIPKYDKKSRTHNKGKILQNCYFQDR